MLEIPLPKIRFTNEKEYEKKLVVLGEYLYGENVEKIRKIRNLDEYEITGFIYYKSNLQYSLVEGIPILGDFGNLDRLTIDAGYFYIAFEEDDLRKRIYERMSAKGLKEILI